MSSALSTSPPRHRYHPYIRPVYPNPVEGDTAYEPRVDSLRDIIRSVGPGAATKVDQDKEHQNAEQEGNNRLIMGGILLLNFFVAYFLFRRQI